MIPEKAIKKITKPAHLEIAVGSLIAYGVFPQTTEGIEKAKALVVTKDTWLAPSSLPNYYDGIDSDLMAGRETPGILNIRQKLKEFYGISSGSELAVDTRITKEENQFEDSNVSVYKPSDKFVDDKVEFADNQVRALDDAIDEIEDKQEKFLDEFEKQAKESFSKLASTEKNVVVVDFPKEFTASFQYAIPPAHYMQGQAGRFTLKFENDIDHAVYYAGKPVGGSGRTRSEKQEKVLEWLKSLGLTYEEIVNHRKKIIEKIRNLTNVFGGAGVSEIPVPSTDQSFTIDLPEEPDELEDEIDDLLDMIREKDEPEEDPEEIPENLDALLAEVKSTAEQEEPKQTQGDGDIESLLADVPESIREELADVINRKKGQEGDKEKKSYYVSNTKLLKDIKSSMQSVTGMLEQVNKSLIQQNELIQSNIEINLTTLEAIQAQDEIIESKFNALLGVFKEQEELAAKAAEDEERRRAEAALENKTVAAGFESPEKLKKGQKGGGPLGRIIRYFGRRLAGGLWRKFAPKWVRTGLRFLRYKAFKFKNLPKRLATKAASRVAQSVAPNVAEKLAKAPSKGKLVEKILRSPSFQRALASKLGKEGAEKLTVKLAAKLIPGVSTAYGLGEGITRMLLGDIKGGFLSFGSAIPIAGWGFAAIDIFRDIDIDAYTEHIEPNLPAPSDENFVAFFSEALGLVQGQDYELGTQNPKSGTPMLHGTELVINNDKVNYNATPIRSILAATDAYMKALGPQAAQISPYVREIADPLEKIYGMPPTLTTANIGGAFTTGSSIFEKKKDQKGDKDKKDKYEGMTKEERELEELLENSANFAEKILKMIDPGNIFGGLIRNIFQNPFRPQLELDTSGVEGDLKGKIVNPLEGGELQDYGPAKFGASRSGGTRRHNGRDIIGPPGMKVTAALPGTVTGVYDVGKLPSGGWSKRVDIKHDNGMVTKYMHIHTSVKVGDEVRAGQQVGTLTEKDNISSAPHLHFELWVNGVAVDPDKPGSSLLQNAHKISDIQAGKVAGLSIESHAGTEDVAQESPPESLDEQNLSEDDQQTLKQFKTKVSFTENQRGKVKNTDGSMFDPLIPSADQISMLNMEDTDEEEQYIYVTNNSSTPPVLPQLGTNFVRVSDGSWRSTYEHNIKTIELLRLSLQ